LFFNDLIVKNYSSTNLYHYPLKVSPDFLLNGTIQEKAKNNIQDSELSLQFEKIEKLPDDKKHLVKEFLDAFILKSNLQQQLT
jgi:hypothetical protein